MNKQDLIKKIKAKIREDKISCSQALKIAEEEGISPKALGEILNEEKIKIAHCQLGCFG
jgi:hypothetical protein